MKFTLEIKMSGQAFEDPSELARIIKDQVLNRIDISNKSCGGIDGKVRDINGNTVGQWNIPLKGKAEDEANARLIAAAPELLEQCKLFEKCLTHLINSGDSGADLERDKLREVLAKVEGGEG